MDGSLGSLFLSLSVILAFWSFLMSLVGQNKGVDFLKKTSLWGFHASTVSIIAASAVLMLLFLNDHFEVDYVFSYSALEQSTIYKLAAFYAGREGSLLLWALMLSVSSSLHLVLIGKKRREDFHQILAALAFIQLFFNALLYFISSPFPESDFLSANGKGLNPLLENFYMIIHPPALYLGFIIFTVPFANALVSLYRKETDGGWISRTRLWILWAWLLLGLGNVLGSYWAYIELGWGGFWAWDPVENASLIPWLISTALVHSILVEKRIGMFRIWNFVLIFTTFISTIIATFLTRSGVVSSVHAFAKSEVANYFVAFIILLTVTTFGLLIFRSKGLASLASLASKKQIDSFTSRESWFALLNMLFIASGIAVLLGTLMPAITEGLGLKKITLEAPYYNRVFAYIGLAILFGIGFCPLLSWGKAMKDYLNRNTVSYLAVVLISAAVAAALGERSVIPIVSYGLGLGAIFTSGRSLAAVLFGGKAKQGSIKAKRGGLIKKLFANGGPIAHVGVILLIMGITGAAGKVESEKTLNKGESYTFKDYRLVYNGFKYLEDSRKEMVFADFDIFKGAEKVAELTPAKFFYKPTLEGAEPQPSTEMGVMTTLKEDLILILMSFDFDKSIAQMKFMINPLMIWLWIGSFILFAGTGLSIIGASFPNRKE